MATRTAALTGSAVPVARTEEKPIARRRLKATEAADAPKSEATIETAEVRAPRWRAHDRTHLELEVKTPARAGECLWEAYFFLPSSLRVSAETRDQTAIYRTFQSYVRLAPRAVSASELQVLAGALPLTPDARTLRVFACQFRHAARRGRKAVLDGGDGSEAFVHGLRDALETMRERLQHHRDGEVFRWVDEDLSRVLEGCAGDMSIALRNRGAHEEARRVAAFAVQQAAYRRAHELGGVGHHRATKRDVEHLEYRRHLLKRFTSSVLWLKCDVSEAGRYTTQVLYAIAASVAMAFAVAAALYHGTPDQARMGSLWTWTFLVMLAYAGKDRLKATLQGVFTRWIRRFLPDRRWRLFTGRGARAGRIVERTAFVEELPNAVRARREESFRHRLDGLARPERVLWHEKRCTVNGSVGGEFDGVSEIFRLDLSDWLRHTDEPKQRIVFADADDGHVYSATAPRVYNLNIVYRCRAVGEETAWQRTRVVISRKGIRRIERVEPAELHAID